MKWSKKFPAKKEVIYLSIDHLKQGRYHLKIIENNKVIKSFKLLKK